MLAGLVRWLKRRVVWQRRIAAYAVVVLHPPLRRKPVVVPSHRIEHGFAAHAMKAGNDVGMRVGKHVADVKRAADCRRRGIDREDVRPQPAAIEAVRAGFLPAGLPLLFQTFERRLFRQVYWVSFVSSVGHPYGFYRFPRARASRRPRRRYL